MFTAAVLVSHAGNLFTFRRQQWMCGKLCCTAELRLNGLAEILQDMKTVGDLPRLGCAFLRPLCKRTAVIVADDLDARMSLEPVCSHAYGALRKDRAAPVAPSPQ